VLGAQLIIQLAVASVGFFLLFTAGRLVFDMRFEGSLVQAFAAFLLGDLSFCSIGLVLASLLPNARTVTIVGNILIYPLVWFSGAAVPLEVMPPAMRGASRYIPLTHVVTLLQGMWKGEPWSAHLTESLVLTAILVIGSLLAVKTFRWE
jgi:ABC-2 type transport system permease protein